MIATHTDHVGSLLRPSTLLRARESFAAGESTAEELRRVEDSAIDRVVALQEEAGCEVVTDGEYRRVSFQSVIVEAADGFGEWDLDAFLWGDWYGDDLEPWHRPRPDALGVVSRLVPKRHPAAEEFGHLRKRSDRILKVTLPSPSLLGNFWSAERSREIYPTLDDFLDDVAALVRGEVAKLTHLGCRYVQLDAPHYPLLVDERTCAFYQEQGWSTTEWLRRGIELDNAVMASFPEVTFGMHLCRGNQNSRWLASGSYEPIAAEIFPRVNAQRLLLEYDDERSGDFRPLRHVPDDKMVVLGLVTTKSPRMETVVELTRSVREAADFVDLERLALSPQCGFSTSIVGNQIGEECQFAKLRRIAETAGEIWG